MGWFRIFLENDKITVDEEGVRDTRWFNSIDYEVTDEAVYIRCHYYEHGVDYVVLFADFQDVNGNVVPVSKIPSYLSGISKIKSDVSVQDSTSPVFDIYFSESLGPPTTVAVDSTIDTYTVTLTDATLFPIGTWTGLFSGASGESRFYWGRVLNRVGNVLTFDSPLDFAFVTGDIALATNRNMAVDGSVTPRVFNIQVGGTDLVLDVTRLIYSMVTTNPIQLGLFGDIPALTNGVLLRKVDGEYRNLNNVKTNYELGTHMYDISVYEQIKQSDVNALLGRSTFAGQSKRGAVIRLSAGEQLQILVQDDLSDLLSVEVMAQGSEVVF